MKPEPMTCVLCHRTDSDVRVALMAFENGDKPYYGTDPRCPDHVACRQRVEAQGEDWPLVVRDGVRT